MNKKTFKYNKLFLSLISLCILTMIICGGTLLSVTWALLTDDAISDSNKISTGTYSMSTIVVDSSFNSLTSQENTYVIPAEPDIYTMVLNADASDGSTGYAKITLTKGEETIVFYTSQIGNDDLFEIEFNNQSNQEVKLSIDYIWGTFVNPSNEEILTHGQQIGIN